MPTHKIQPPQTRDLAQSQQQHTAAASLGCTSSTGLNLQQRHGHAELRQTCLKQAPQDARICALCSGDTICIQGLMGCFRGSQLMTPSASSLTGFRVYYFINPKP